MRGNIDKLIPIKTNYLIIYLNLILNKGSLPLIFAADEQAARSRLEQLVGL